MNTHRLRAGARTMLRRTSGIGGTLILVVPTVLADSSYTASSGRPFAPDSVWNSAIASGPTLMSNSATIVARLSAGQHVADLNEYAVPIYDASAHTPVVSIRCTEAWGGCPIPTTIRLPAGAVPNTGSDHTMVSIDWTVDPPLSYDFWGAAKLSDGALSTAWGGITYNLTDGSGIAPGGGTSGSATATNVSRLAGVIRIREIRAGVIPHALAIASSIACSGSFRYPAAKTDGTDTDPNCIPEGARVQLNPALDISALPAGERIIAKALQTYGAYIVDRSAVPVAMVFEGDPALIGRPDRVPAAYQKSGLAWDFYDMTSIAWADLNVLQQWDGAPEPGTRSAPPA